MNTTELRMSIIEKIMLLGDQALEKINLLAEQEIGVNSVPESHYKLLDKNRQAYLTGERELHTLSEFQSKVKEKHGI